MPVPIAAKGKRSSCEIPLPRFFKCQLVPPQTLVDPAQIIANHHACLHGVAKHQSEDHAIRVHLFTLRRPLTSRLGQFVDQGRIPFAIHSFDFSNIFYITIAA